MSQHHGCNVYVRPIETGGFEYGGEQNGQLVASGFSFGARSEAEARTLAEKMIDRNFQSSLNKSPGAKKKQRTKNPGRS
jgi:hypothetical protein